MNTTTNFLAVAHNPLIIQGHINEANKAYRLSKESAARAAAYAYLVWRDTLGSSASPQASEWFYEQVRKINLKIAEENKADDQLRKYAKAFKTDKLGSVNKGDLALQESDDPEEIALIEARKKLLTQSGKLTARDWENRRQIPIKTRENASPFTTIVKFVFAFYHPKDSSVTSRYARMLEWIHARFEGKGIPDAQAIVDEIQSKGGFERALEEHRGNEAKKPSAISDITGAERNGMLKYTVEKIEAAYKAATPRIKIEFASQSEDHELVMLMGRKNGSQVEIIDEMKLDKKTRSNVISLQEADQIIPVQAAAEFIGRVLGFGQIISLDEPAEKTEFDLKSGEPIAIDRVITLVPHDHADFQMIVSTRHVDASMVVKALPKSGEINLGKISRHVFLENGPTNLLEKLVNKLADRRLFEFSTDPEQAAVKWYAKNIAVQADLVANATRSFNWSEMASKLDLPLDVIGARADVVKKWTKADIKEQLSNFSSSGDDTSKKKKAETIELSFDGVSVDGTVDLNAELDSGHTQKATLHFRRKDIVPFFEALASQKAEKYLISVDRGGLLTAIFEDDLALYELHLPSAIKDTNRLQARRTEPMHIQLDADEADADGSEL